MEWSASCQKSPSGEYPEWLFQIQFDGLWSLNLGLIASILLHRTACEKSLVRGEFAVLDLIVQLLFQQTLCCN